MILLKKENKNDIKTIEGQNAQIEGANITDFELKGDTLQNDTPTPDTPVEIQSVTGIQEIEIHKKNLFSSELELGSITSAGINAIADDCIRTKDFIKVKPNTTYTISNDKNYYNHTYEYGKNKNFIIAYTSNNRGTFTFTTSENTNYVRFRTNRSTIENDFKTKFQLEKGNQATTYEPYKGNTYEVNLGNIELNKIGDYQDSIKKSTGKNLFDKDNANILSGISIGSSTIGTNVNAKTLYIPIKENTTYTIQKIISSRFRIATTNEIPANGVSVSNYSSNDSSSRATIATSTGHKYLCIYYYISSDTITEQQILDSIMINEGSTALPYEPYGKVWYICNKVGKVVLTGSETWDYNTNLGWRTDKNATLIKNSSVALSNKYTYTSSTWQGNYTFSINSAGYIAISDNTYNTLANWQNYLSSNNVEVIYQLETPTYTEITSEELINQLEEISKAKLLHGENNITITASDLVGTFKISYDDWYKFEKILRSGYNIKEDYDRITQKFINGRRKQILSDYEDCIIQLSLGTFDLDTTVEYLKMLEDGEYEYYSFNDHDYKRADFLLEERPEIIVANSLKEDEAEIEDFDITLLKAGE